jgi:hypothetical protein
VGKNGPPDKSGFTAKTTNIMKRHGKTGFPGLPRTAAPVRTPLNPMAGIEHQTHE